MWAAGREKQWEKKQERERLRGRHEKEKRKI